MIRAALFLAFGSLALAGCGLRPLYGGPGNAVVGTLDAIEVAPIEGQAGWLVTNALRDRLHQGSTGTAPRYRLDVRLDDSLTGLGIRRDDSVTRERRTLRARYQLVDLATGKTLLDATAGSDAGIDVAGSQYATIAAERSALERLSEIVADQIVSRVALRTRQLNEAGAGQGE